MNYYGNPITRLIEQLAGLPGIGGKSAQRLAFHIIHMPEGTTMGYILFDFPLPQEVQDQDALSVEFTLNRSNSIMYQDESGFYSKGISNYSVKIPLSIRKNAKTAEALTGIAALEDGYIAVLATISDVEIRTTVTITASQERIEELSTRYRETISYDLYAGGEKCSGSVHASIYEDTSITTEMSFRLPKGIENLTLVPSYTSAEGGIPSILLK